MAGGAVAEDRSDPGDVAPAHTPPDRSVPVSTTTVGAALREAAATHGSRPALTFASPGAGVTGRWSFAELLDGATRVARALLARYEPGDRVAIWAPNAVEWVLCELGTALAGVALVPINPAFRRDEVAHALRASSAKGLFTVAEHRGQALRAIGEGLVPELPELREVIAIDDGWDAFLARGDGRTAELPDVLPGDVAEVQFTSGTTGTPKGVVLEHHCVTVGSRLVFARLGLGPGDTVIHAMPMFHTGGACVLTLGALQAGAHHVLMGGFDPALWLELIERERGTVIMGVPTMFHMMLGHPDAAGRDTSSLRLVCSGGSAISSDLLDRLERELGAGYAALYGQTETAGVLAVSTAEDEPHELSTHIGRPLPGVEAKIVDVTSGETLNRDEDGELCVRGPVVMREYDGWPEATAAALDPDGWLHTGDLCAMDERGLLRIAGRLKDLIHRGGENISPVEVENVLAGHPAVDAVAVVGVPDDTWGETVAAFVQPTAEHGAVDAEALTAFVRERLASFKRPRVWVAVEGFPLTASGKVKKHELRDAWVRGAFAASDVTQV